MYLHAIIADTDSDQLKIPNFKIQKLTELIRSKVKTSTKFIKSNVKKSTEFIKSKIKNQLN